MAVPPTKPSWTAVVSQPAWLALRPQRRWSSGETALAVNHRDMPKSSAEARSARANHGAVGVVSAANDADLGSGWATDDKSMRDKRFCEQFSNPE